MSEALKTIENMADWPNSDDHWADIPGWPENKWGKWANKEPNNNEHLTKTKRKISQPPQAVKVESMGFYGKEHNILDHGVSSKYKPYHPNQVQGYPPQEAFTPQSTPHFQGGHHGYLQRVNQPTHSHQNHLKAKDKVKDDFDFSIQPPKFDSIPFMENPREGFISPGNYQKISFPNHHQQQNLYQPKPNNPPNEQDEYQQYSSHPLPNHFPPKHNIQSKEQFNGKGLEEQRNKIGYGLHKITNEDQLYRGHNTPSFGNYRNAFSASKVPQIHPSKVKNYKRKAPPTDSPIQEPQPTFEDEDFEKEVREGFLDDFDEFPFEQFTDDKDFDFTTFEQENYLSTRNKISEGEGKSRKAISSFDRDTPSFMTKSSKSRNEDIFHRPKYSDVGQNYLKREKLENEKDNLDFKYSRDGLEMFKKNKNKVLPNAKHFKFNQKLQNEEEDSHEHSFESMLDFMNDPDLHKDFDGGIEYPFKDPRGGDENVPISEIRTKKEVSEFEDEFDQDKAFLEKVFAEFKEKYDDKSEDIGGRRISEDDVIDKGSYMITDPFDQTDIKEKFVSNEEDPMHVNEKLLTDDRWELLNINTASARDNSMSLGRKMNITTDEGAWIPLPSNSNKE